MGCSLLLLGCVVAALGQQNQFTAYKPYSAKNYDPSQQYYQQSQSPQLIYQQMQNNYQQEYARYLNYLDQQARYQRQQQEYARNNYYRQQQQPQTTEAPNYWKASDVVSDNLNTLFQSLGYGSDDQGNVWIGDDIAKINIIAKTSWP